MKTFQKINHVENDYKKQVETALNNVTELHDRRAPEEQIKLANSELSKLQTNRHEFLKTVDKSHIEKAIQEREAIQCQRQEIVDAVNRLDFVDSVELSTKINLLNSKLHEMLADCALCNKTDDNEQQLIEKELVDLKEQLRTASEKNNSLNQAKALIESKLTPLDAEIDEANKAIAIAQKNYALNCAEKAAEDYFKKSQALIESYELMLAYQSVLNIKGFFQYGTLVIPTFIGLESLLELNKKNKFHPGAIYDGDRVPSNRIEQKALNIKDDFFS